MKILPPSTPSVLPVKIANVSMRVPVCVDEETTRGIVEALNARIKQIEEKAPRIDTQAFALQTAYEAAVDLYLLRRDQERDIRELGVALDGIATQLSELAEDFAPVEKPERKKE